MLHHNPKDEESYQNMAFAYDKNSKSTWWSRRPTWQKIAGCVLLIVIIAALTIGLGIGLTRGSSSGNDNEGGSTTSPTSGNTTAVNGTFWKPEVKATWQIELLYPLNDTDVDATVWDIDLFINNASIIDQLHSQNRKVICYFSAGSYENWRPDKDKFKKSDLGKTLDGWANEKWLDINSNNVRNIMLDRLDLAVSKNCDGVDPDNVDGYDNSNGLGLTEDDSINYMKFLANGAHSRNMSIGLKNAGDIIPDVINWMQWSVNEQCIQYDECDTYDPFIQQNKPVFHIEYPSSAPHITVSQKNNVCGSSQATNFSTVIKNMDLDNWVTECS
ncbi:MAG: hypothetical protein M1834_003278 [Cirrosporium novae-zelandiae]|nr:MAG: hypothetical protein M1834_003278 [Cirrosporium novae-zelandiae]